MLFVFLSTKGCQRFLSPGCCGIHSELGQVRPESEGIEKSCQQGWVKDGLCRQVTPHKTCHTLNAWQRYEDRTVYHDFFTQFGQSKIFVQQQPPGYGIRAHRAIKAICQMCGIKVSLKPLPGGGSNILQDLHAKCEGSLNVQTVVKAFVLGLLRQRTHQALADEKQLHLVGRLLFLSNCPMIGQCHVG